VPVNEFEIQRDPLLRTERSGVLTITAATDYGYRTLEEAIAALEDLYATGEVLPSEQPRIEHRTGEPCPYVIAIGRKSKSVAESF
jgi:hypothetical protein